MTRAPIIAMIDSCVSCVVCGTKGVGNCDCVELLNHAIEFARSNPNATVSEIELEISRWEASHES